MPTVYGPLDIVKNELRNCVVQNLGTAPAAPVKGLIYFDSTANILYWYNGTAWVAAQGGAALTPASTVTTQAIGDAPVVGTSANYAREDHKHGEPAFGAITVEQTFGSASTNGAATTLARSDHAHGNPTHDNAAHSAIALSALGVPTASVNLNSQKIINLTDPTLATDATTKQYVDSLVAGLSWKDVVRLASTANVVVATGGLVSVDGVTTVAGDRVLLKNQTTAAENGIYLAALGAWTRTTDADTEADLLNAAVFVSAGTVNADTAWVMTSNAPITVGTTGLTWVQFSGAGTYTAGNGLTLTANTFDVGAGTGITVAADTVAVDTSVVATIAFVNGVVTNMAKKITFALTGTSSPEVVTHNFGTRDVLVQVLNGASPYTAVEVDWDATTTNTVTIRYNPNLGAGYRAVVIGG
jgi:hypothetical protein